MRTSNSEMFTLNRNGLTILECLFAMSIMLVGLVGIASMVPFAGRQAADSYAYVQGLNAGDNAVAVFNSSAAITPSLSAPWQLVDDAYPVSPPASLGLPSPLGDSSASSFESLPKLYEGDRQNGRLYSLYKYYYDLFAASYPNSPAGQQTRAAVAQNRALGTGFCIDPMFWAQQLQVPAGNTKLRDRDWGNFRRTRFPYYHETYPNDMNPFSTSPSTFTTPRLVRVSLHDPHTALGTAFKGWLRLPASVRLATVSGGDVLKITPEQDRSSGPIRGFAPSQLPGEALVQPLPSETMQSWIATLTPSETTPVVDPTTLPIGPYDELPNTPIPPPPSLRFYPELYDLAIVVFRKRNTTELVISDYPIFAADGIVPDGERLAKVVSFGVEHRTSSTFELELDSSANVSGKLKVGDWLMMSRYVYSSPETLVDPIREQHKWYRVLNVTGDDVFPRQVRVSGQPWDWTLPEIEVFKSMGLYSSSAALPPIPPATTVVTLVPNVINVFERTIRVSAN